MSTAARPEPSPLSPRPLHAAPHATAVRARASAWSFWRTVAVAHGMYFAATGIWPLLHMSSFLTVTGPKTDLWLVRLVGALVAVPGLLLLRMAVSGRVDRTLVAISCWFAAILGAADLIGVGTGTLPPIYLADAAAEAVLLGMWTGAAFVSRQRE